MSSSVPRRFDPRPPASGRTDGSDASGRRGLGVLVLGLIALLAAIALLAGFTGPHDSGRAIEALAALAAGGLPALLWLLAAAGLGRAASPLLRPRAFETAAALAPIDRLLLEVASGVCLLAALDATLGRLGLAGPWLLWPLTVALAAAALWRRRVFGAGGALRPSPGDAWTLLAIVPAVAVLLVAAAAAPGWLWSSEFGGYDALAYHLELPRRWIEAGEIGPLEGNVYAFLPSHLEAAFLHLMVLRGDPLAAAIPAQFLHALLAILTAATLGRAASRSLPATPRGLGAGVGAAGIFLGIPWVVVVGSLAYNEMAAMLPLAAGLLLLLPRRDQRILAAEETRPASESWRLGLLLGVLMGGAIGAKATAVGSVAAPLGMLLLAGGPCLPHRRVDRILAASVAAGSAAILLLPWAIQSTAAAGSPLFPLFAAAFPSPLWDAEQARIFADAHGPPAAWRDRLGAAWHELLRLGIGPNPDPGAPWQPQWSLLWWFAAAAVAASLSLRGLRPVGGRLLLVLGMQLLFWLLFTHAKSRFMLPAAVPAALAMAIAIASPRHGAATSRLERGLARLALLAWCLLPAAIFLRERPIDGVPAPAAATGQVAALSGALHERLRSDPRLSREERAAVLATAPPWTFINDSGLSGREGRVLLLGERRTFYLRRPFSAATVWERGEISQLARTDPEAFATWRTALADRGFTLLLVDRGMIARWWRDGWWDPSLPPETIDRFLATLPSLRRFPYGLELFSLEARGEARDPR